MNQDTQSLVASLRQLAAYQHQDVSIAEEAADEIERLSLGAERYKRAIASCLDFANGREVEWGSRAMAAFEILQNALYRNQ